MNKFIRLALLGSLLSFSLNAFADITVPMYLTSKDGSGKSIGTVVFSDSKYGLQITPHLTGLTPGIHGFHIHQNPSCANAGMAAGGHLDPQHTNMHAGPYSDSGHLGDLPVLFVDNSGQATLPILAPRLKLADIGDHSVMIHAGGDNYSDTPPMGGGGARVACGVIPANVAQ